MHEFLLHCNSCSCLASDICNSLFCTSLTPSLPEFEGWGQVPHSLYGIWTHATCDLSLLLSLAQDNLCPLTFGASPLPSLCLCLSQDEFCL